MMRQHGNLAVLGGKGDLVYLGFIDGALGRDDLKFYLILSSHKILDIRNEIEEIKSRNQK